MNNVFPKVVSFLKIFILDFWHTIWDFLSLQICTDYYFFYTASLVFSKFLINIFLLLVKIKYLNLIEYSINKKNDRYASFEHMNTQQRYEKVRLYVLVVINWKKIANLFHSISHYKKNISLLKNNYKWSCILRMLIIKTKLNVQDWTSKGSTVIAFKSLHYFYS